MKQLLLVGFILLSLTAKAEFSADYARSSSGSSYSNQLGLQLDSEFFVNEETFESPLKTNISYEYVGSTLFTSLNSNLPEFEVIAKTNAIAGEVELFDLIGFGLDLSKTQFNDGEAEQNAIGGSLTLQLDNFKFGIRQAYSRTQQVRDVFVLGQNVTDDIKISQRTSSYFVNYGFLEKWQLSGRYTYYSYDEKLDNLYAILITQLFLDRAGSAVASEIPSQTKDSYDLSMSYYHNENWSFTVGGGSSREILSPQETIRYAQLGADYNFTHEQFSYRLFVTVESAKAESQNERSGSGSFGVGVSF